MPSRTSTVDAHVYASPRPETVAFIMAREGLEAASERWFWCEPRTLATLARIGRAQTGMTPKGGRIHRSALAGREGVAVEAALVLGNLTAVDTALGVPVNATGAAFQGRGLPVPRNNEARSVEGRIGHRIRRGDETAVAEREARRAHAVAVCAVVEAALALVPEQPRVGRYRLPPVNDDLRIALAGLSPAAVTAVFPALSAE
jgi:hypothetical protein